MIDGFNGTMQNPPVHVACVSVQSLWMVHGDEHEPFGAHLVPIAAQSQNDAGSLWSVQRGMHVPPAPTHDVPERHWQSR